MRPGLTAWYRTNQILGGGFLRFQQFDFVEPKMATRFLDADHLQAIKMADASQSYDNKSSVSFQEWTDCSIVAKLCRLEGV